MFMRCFSLLLFVSFTVALTAETVVAQIPPPQDDFGPPEQNRFGGPPPFGRPRFGQGRGFGGPRSTMQASSPAKEQPSQHVLSALSDSQKVATFSGNVRARLSGNFLDVDSEGIPNHPTGNFPNEYNPNSILEQDYHFHIPLKPKFAQRTTELPFGPIGVAVNGIPFYNPYNAQGRDAVFGPNAEVFDSCCGHPDQAGRYHYHKYPVCIKSPFHDPIGTHSPLIGWAFDGFAIYGPNGENGKPPFDLDQCNGHIDNVRGYHYHVTTSFPYVLGAYRGVVELSNFEGPVW